MKKTILLNATLLLFLSSPLLAQDVKVDWSLNLFPLDGENYAGLSVDAGIGPRYVRLNGALLASNGGDDIPVTGTCIATDPMVVTCDLQLRQYLMILEVNSSLGGSFRLLDRDGIQFNSGMLFYTGIVSN